MSKMDPKEIAEMEKRLSLIGERAGLKTAPAGLTNRVMARVFSRPTPRPILLEWRTWAAAALLLVGIGLGRWSAKGQGQMAVQFMLEAEKAQNVSLVGDFTNWEPVPLNRKGARWVLNTKVPVNQRFQYAYVLNGRLLVVDPRAEIVETDGTGTCYSVLDTRKFAKL